MYILYMFPVLTKQIFLKVSIFSYSYQHKCHNMSGFMNSPVIASQTTLMASWTVTYNLNEWPIMCPAVVFCWVSSRKKCTIAIEAIYLPWNVFAGVKVPRHYDSPRTQGWFSRMNKYESNTTSVIITATLKLREMSHNLIWASERVVWYDSLPDLGSNRIWILKILIELVGLNGTKIKRPKPVYLALQTG
jgi:hypothetical protein